MPATTRHASRVPVGAVARLLVAMVRRLMGMRMLLGVLHRFTHGCRKLTHSTLITLLYTSLRLVPIDSSLPAFGQIRLRAASG